MPKKDIAIRVDNVSKSFRLPHERADSVKSLFVNPLRHAAGKDTETQHALKNISFKVEKGDFFGIVGRNGSGKSTLLKILAGIYQPNKGSVTVDGRLVPFIELGVGFNPELTGRENVYLNGALMGFSAKEVDAKYTDIVDFSELERFMDQRLKNYSSGMQVRLAFSVATILADSDILLIDEVLAVGDADFQRKCFDFFKKLKRNDKTVVFVSHDMDAVREYCDKAILIDKSEIIYAGTSERIAKEYSRLFRPDLEKQLQKAEEAEKRQQKWGDGSVEITNLKFSQKVLRKDDDTITISYDVIPQHDFDDEIVTGIVIKNESGEAVCGTNSDILKVGPLLPKKSEKMHFEWTVPHIFNDGAFIVEPSVIMAGNAEVCQWWDDAASFRVINKQKVPYLVAPKIQLSVKG